MTTPSDQSATDQPSEDVQRGASSISFPVLKLMLAALFNNGGGSMDVTVISHGTLFTGTAVSPSAWMKELANVHRPKLTPESTNGETIFDALELVADELDGRVEADQMRHLHLINVQMWPVGGTCPTGPGYPYQVDFDHVSAWTMGRASTS